MDNQNQTNQSSSNPLPQQTTPVPVEETGPIYRAEKLKRIFFQVLIGCLVAAAAIAVTAVLVGGFNDTLGKSLGTIFMVALHSLLSFSFIANSEKRNNKDHGRSIDLFSNTMFALIVISFITSVFNIWQLFGGEITFKLYLFYGVVLFTTLHADTMYRISGLDKKTDIIVIANYIFMFVVSLMLTIVIFASNSSDLGEFFYRILAAAGIIDATLTTTASITHKMYLQKHPDITTQDSQPESSKSNYS